MSVLRRLFGGPQRGDRGARDRPAPDAGNAAALEEDERAHERAVVREEAERLSEFQRRQLRYADHAWTPPPQGGTRRADDGDRAANDGPAESG